MARLLKLKLDDKEFSVSPENVDRKKLYGWNEVVAVDDNGNQCGFVYMDESGTVMIPPKGTATGSVTLDKRWVSKDELVAVKDGKQAVKTPSAYSSTVVLDKEVSVEEYLNHTIESFYQLNFPEDAIPLIKDKIFSFSYCYNDAYDTSTAFIVESGGKAFMLIGTPTNFEPLTLEELSAISAEEDAAEEEESDPLDFNF